MCTYECTLPGPSSVDAIPAAHGDVLAELADERLARRFDGFRAARERLGAEVGAVLGLARGRDDTVHELQEVVVARREVGLDVDLDEHAALAVGARRLRRPRPRSRPRRRAWRSWRGPSSG